MANPIVVASWRGGLNLYDPPTSLPQDQVVEATNVEWSGATLADRRLGHTAITLPSDVLATSGVWKMHRHLPSNDESASELWLVAGTPSGSAFLSYKKDSTWTTVSLIDSPTVTSATLPRFRFQTVHGKLFISYPSAQDRMHVWTGTTLRRAGLASPAAPSVANTGAAGTFSGKRYYRIRYTELSGSSILRRSEPSTATSITPSGTNTGITVTKPAAISEGETHWEVEASLNNADFYMVSRIVVATTTYTDTVAFQTGYSSSPLSEDVGDYTLLGSAKFILADDDRLLLLGNWSDTTKSSRVQWTPPQKDPGFGSDERIKLSTDPFIDLDGYEGGEITGGKVGNGVIYVFKWSHIYRLSRTGQLSQAYEAFPVSKTLGAVPGSIFEGVDNQGNPTIFFVDRIAGPCMLGRGGLTRLVRDIKPLWDSRDITTNLEAYGIYYPYKRQARWEFTVSGVSGTSAGMVLHLDELRITEEGGTRGWAKWTGLTSIGDAILYADNVESGSARTTNLKPLFATNSSGPKVVIADSGTEDAGTAFAASAQSRPFILGGGSNSFGIRAAAIVATAGTGVTVDISARKDFGKETTKTVSNISLTPSGSETHVVPQQDNLFGSECKAIQIKITDSSPATGTWHLHQLTLIPRSEQST